MWEPSGEYAPWTLSGRISRTSPASQEMVQRPIRCAGPTSPSARILVPSRDQEKRAHLKQKSAGTPADAPEIERVSPVSMKRTRMAVESLYATYLPSGDIAAYAIGSSTGFVVICRSVISEAGPLPREEFRKR